MLQRINGILGGNQPSNGGGIRRQSKMEGQEAQQPIKREEKEPWRGPEKMTKAISIENRKELEIKED